MSLKFDLQNNVGVVRTRGGEGLVVFRVSNSCSLGLFGVHLNLRGLRRMCRLHGTKPPIEAISGSSHIIDEHTLLLVLSSND